MTIADIDFCRLYREHMEAAGKAKPSSDWDARAARMNRQTAAERYAQEFIARMDLSGARTLLDVGCGNGAICLPLAERFEQVVGLDYSRGMLDVLEKNAQTQGHANLKTLHLAWEDDWSAVPECDIAIASRSTQVRDLGAALAKLDAKARKRVYLTHLVGGQFIDPGMLEAIGRQPPAPLPDYIYALNILHSRNIHARLDFIESDGRFSGVDSFDEFAQRVIWSQGQLDTHELARLQAWYERAMRAGGIPSTLRWAFISWEKAGREFFAAPQPAR
ncbi:methyltransferase domain-containing protein [Diaphorobacter ruginosibacter]|uniref:class I SAM-dependent methyltransferase n=1 Tax=Diaphorobacter ruginosibacter TaxID=1715720 RepID=UPI0033405005